MTLGKITFDNSVRYIPITEKTREKENKPKKKQKLVHFLVNRTKNHHKTIRNSSKIFQHQDLLHSQISIRYKFNYMNIHIWISVIIQCW